MASFRRRSLCSSAGLRRQRTDGLDPIESHRCVCVGNNPGRDRAIRSNQAQAAVKPTKARVQTQPFLNEVIARQYALPRYVGQGPPGRSAEQCYLQVTIGIIRISARQIFLFVAHAIAIPLPRKFESSEMIDSCSQNIMRAYSVR